MAGGTGGTATHQCGLAQQLIFFGAIASGTACSICSKLMMELHSTGITGEEEVFENPLFQTFGMFVGMTFGMIMHWCVLALGIPFPGYHQTSKIQEGEKDTEKQATEGDPLLQKSGTNKEENPNYTPAWMYFFLAIPSLFDVGATIFCMMGLIYLDVSIYLLLRGSGIIFVALMKQHILRDRLYTFQWIGVAWNVVSVFLVGATAILNSADALRSVKPGEALLGCLLVMAGSFVQALQFVFEEKVMTMEVSAPPLLLIGMEGVWGCLICICILYPLAYYLPGSDHGSYEDPFNTWVMIKNSTSIQWAFVVYFFTIFLYNILAVLVTFMLNSVWHAILDNFRPVSVWVIDMLIFYVITPSFGEPWTKWSYLQLLGMFVLLYGTAVYNAPNAASVRLAGEWYSFGLDFTKDYQEIEEEQREEQLEQEWKDRKASYQERRESSFIGERSPHTSIHIQALRGLGSPKI